jgi:hypothetical protein
LFLAFLFLAFWSWALLVLGVLVLGVWVLGVASSGPGGFRLTRQSSAAALPPAVALPANCSWRVVAGWVSLRGVL